jgi:O-antigen ligase
MIDWLIKRILILLLVFTPFAFGSMEIWALTVMEFGILAMIALYVIGEIFSKKEPSIASADPENTKNNSYRLPIFLLCLFLALILFQMIPLPPGLLKILSPKTYELRQQFAFPFEGQGPAYWPISLFPYATKIEFFKWAALIGFFIFLLHWKGFGRGLKGVAPYIITIMIVGIVESLYGIFEFFSGHRHILHIYSPRLVNSVTGTFINPNNFAGYLLMVIPLSIGYLFAREAEQEFHYQGWRQRLSSLDGKTMLMWFGILVMILALIFSASRMGIACLLLSFSVIALLFRDLHGGRRFSRTLLFILALAVVWAAWLGLDVVIGRFFTAVDDFKLRPMVWKDTFRIFKDFPLLGTGLGTFTQIFPMYQSFHMEAIITHAENDFLQLASETGLLGAAVLLSIFIYFIFKAFSTMGSLAFSPKKYLATGILVAILGLMLFSLMERNIQVTANAFLFVFIVVLLLKPRQYFSQVGI